MTSVFRSLAATLALSAMLLRALLPAGWMPNPAGVADVPLVICSMDGLHRVLPVHAPLKGQQDERGSVCPFAAAAHLAPPQTTSVVTPTLFASRSAPDFAASETVSGVVNSNHAPRGPPISV